MSYEQLLEYIEGLKERAEHELSTLMPEDFSGRAELGATIHTCNRILRRMEK